MHRLFKGEFMNNILTKREIEIFGLLIKNKSTLEISKVLNISEKTVRNHISNVIQKIGVKSRTQAIITLLKNGLIKID